MNAKAENPTKATNGAKRSASELAELRSTLAKLRAKLMAEPQDRPDVMNARIRDVEIMVDDLAETIDAELTR